MTYLSERQTDKQKMRKSMIFLYHFTKEISEKKNNLCITGTNILKKGSSNFMQTVIKNYLQLFH